MDDKVPANCWTFDGVLMEGIPLLGDDKGLFLFLGDTVVPLREGKNMWGSPAAPTYTHYANIRVVRRACVRWGHDGHRELCRAHRNMRSHMLLVDFGKGRFPSGLLPDDGVDVIIHNKKSRALMSIPPGCGVRVSLAGGEVGDIRNQEGLTSVPVSARYAYDIRVAVGNKTKEPTVARKGGKRKVAEPRLPREATPTLGDMYPEFLRRPTQEAADDREGKVVSITDHPKRRRGRQAPAQQSSAAGAAE